MFLKITINPTWIEEDKLLKNDNIGGKKKWVSNIRPDCGVSPETSLVNLNI